MDNEPVDLPGFGLSSRLATASHTALAAALADALIALKIPPAHIVAHSMGGYISALLALECPQLVRTLTLSDAAILRYPHIPRLAATVVRALSRPLASALDRRMAKPRHWERMLRRSYADVVPAGASEGYARPFSAGGIGRTMFSLLLAPARNGVVDQLSQLKVPVLVLWGDRDDTTPLADGQKLAATLGGARLVTFPTGHRPMETCPADFNRELLAFLASASETAAGAGSPHQAAPC